jgi:predicted RNase H-like HicB family nuclease
MKTFHIRTVMFKEDDWWCAQCLEYDIATQAKSISALKAEIEHTLTIHVELAAQRGEEPFANLPKAPERYFQMYDAFEQVNGAEEGALIRAPRGDDNTRKTFATRFAHSRVAFN